MGHPLFVWLTVTIIVSLILISRLVINFIIRYRQRRLFSAGTEREEIIIPVDRLNVDEKDFDVEENL